jgi:hypothetical protein
MLATFSTEAVADESGMIDKVLEKLLGYGVPGLGFLGAIGIIWYLLEEKRGFQKKIDERDAKIETLHVARIEDAKLFGERLAKDNEDWMKLKEGIECCVQRRDPVNEAPPMSMQIDIEEDPVARMRRLASEPPPRYPARLISLFRSALHLEDEDEEAISSQPPKEQ